jgi:hypothetical protein
VVHIPLILSAQPPDDDLICQGQGSDRGEPEDRYQRSNTMPTRCPTSPRNTLITGGSDGNIIDRPSPSNPNPPVTAAHGQHASREEAREQHLSA